MLIKNKIVLQRTVRSPIHHLLMVGASGTGKDFVGERIVSKYYQTGRFKVIDFFSLERFEGMGYSVPQQNPDLIEIGKNLTGGVYEPCGFPNRIYMIYGSKLEKYKQLPKNVEIISLREKDLDAEDIINLLGSTESAKGFLFMIMRKIKQQGTDDVTLTDVERILEQIMDGNAKDFKGMSVSTAFVIKRNIELLRKSGIFDKEYPNGEPIPQLNIKKMMNEKSITTFSCSLLETTIERAVGLGILLKKIVNYNQNSEYKIPLFIYFREIQQLYSVSNKKNDFFNMLREYIYYCLTEGRDNRISLGVNAQRLDQIKEIAGYFNKIFSLRLTKDDAKTLQNYAKIDNYILDKIMKLERGMGIFICNGEFDYPIETIPPQFQKKEEGTNVLQNLGDVYGWIDYSNKLKKSDEDPSINRRKSLEDEPKNFTSTSKLAEYKKNKKRLFKNEHLKDMPDKEEVWKNIKAISL